MKTINTYITERLQLGKKLSKSQKHMYTPDNVDELYKILENKLSKDKNANLNDIDVSKITDMCYYHEDTGYYGLFFRLDPHKIDISEWDVSNVHDMSYMFYECKNLECDISDWNTNNVEFMRYMFYKCKKFNCNLSKWNTLNLLKKLQPTSGQFFGCDKLIKNNLIPYWYKE